MKLTLNEDFIFAYLPDRMYALPKHLPPMTEFFYTLLLGHCAASRKVAGLIPDGVIEIFH
jgi:hypothetical protein